MNRPALSLFSDQRRTKFSQLHDDQRSTETVVEGLARRRRFRRVDKIPQPIWKRSGFSWVIAGNDPHIRVDVALTGLENRRISATRVLRQATRV